MSCPSTSHTGSDNKHPGSRPVTADPERCRSVTGDGDDHRESDSRDLEAANAQLSKNLRELTQTYRELEDVVSVAQTSLMFVDFELKVQRFTRPLKEQFALTDAERGKPIKWFEERLNFYGLEQLTTQVLSTARPEESELCAPNGHWFLVRLRPDIIVDGKADGVVLDFTDITRRKEAELSSERSRRYAEKILETLQEPIMVLSSDLCVKSANPAFYRIFRHEPASIEGRPVFEIGNGQWDCPRFRELLERVLPNNEHFEGFELTHDFAGVGKRTLQLNFQRLDEEQMILLAVHDITPNRQVDRLRHRESSLMEEVGVRSRLQEMASSVLQSENMQEMFDFTLAAAVDLSGADYSMLEIVNDQGELETTAHRGFDEALLKRCQEHGGPSGLAFSERRRVVIDDVETMDFDPACLELARQAQFRAIQATPLIGRSGNLLGVLSTYYRDQRDFGSRDEYVQQLLAVEIADLCEWLKTEKRLRQSETRLRAQSEQLLANDRQKNQFLGLLGHELRNPLTVMRNSIQTLVAEEHAFVADPRISEALALLERQSRHMTHLVNDLLDITRINNGKVVLKRERVSLGRCLDEVLAAHRSMINSRDLSLSVRGRDVPIYLDADAARLFQVLDNLLTNAIKFTQPGGRIEVAMERQQEQALIRVKDTGIGIPAESIGSLFDPFTQVDNNLACHGLGLGLSLVKSLVDLHGGTIRAHSEGEDKGSEFSIQWPLHEQQEQAEEQSAPPALTLSSSAHPQRILVVDDIADIADSFARLLEVAGHEVLVAYDAEQGLKLAREHRPTVAFLDMIMPETDGLELARQLRQEFRTEELTLVVVSGYGQNQDIQRARDAGVEHHLLKPIEVQQVYSLLDSLVH